MSIFPGSFRYAVLVLACFAFSCSGAGAGPNDTSLPPSEDAFLAQSTPEEQGVDSDVLAGMIGTLENKGTIHSIVIVRNNRIILEYYKYPYNQSTVFNVKSVTKSIESTLVGIALREGKLKGLDQKVAGFFPEYVALDDSAKQGITIKDLLTMRSGLDVDDEDIWSAIRSGDNWIRDIWERPMRGSPGAKFNYSSADSHLMGAALARATGKSMVEYADEHIFKPLGFEGVQWSTDPSGYNVGGHELFIRPIDMAKFGVLCLANGRWGEKELIPAEWLHESVSTQVQNVQGPFGYGYWWWIEPEVSFNARGWGGQQIAVFPNLNMVVAITSSEDLLPEFLITNFIKPAIQSEHPLPPSPKGAARLAELSNRASNPMAQPFSTIPSRVSSFLGKRLIMESNLAGVQAITFNLLENGSNLSLTIERTSGIDVLPIGIDNVYRISDVLTSALVPQSMPSNNRIATRGFCEEPSRCFLDMIDLGNPLMMGWDIQFDDTGASITIWLTPFVPPLKLRANMAERDSSAPIAFPE